MSPKSEFRYAVFAYSNFHFMGDSEKYLVGEFGDCARAVATCQKLIDDFLLSIQEQTGSADSLMTEYESSGPEPYIQTEDESCRFSAAGYARRRIDEISR